ncbi:MAG: aspartate kinase, partial [Myxococcota bacterium]
MSSEFVVLKFGGTSVSTRERWETLESVARGVIASGDRPVIVCSAISGVSNLLDTLLQAAMDQKHQEVLEQIRDKHAALARALGVDMDDLIGDDLAALERRALGASLLGEVSPRLQAVVMSSGELMSTKLGAAFLSSRGVSTSWRDARDILAAVREENTNPQRHFLSATCEYGLDEALRAEFAASSAQVLLTQGFIARDDAGETVLLGRGGSDTSAAYMAAKLGASRLEIWTDVPGMFTANPRDIPSARLLRRLGYMEAQELATMGAKVLHPRCIDPVRAHAIPLHIKCTPHPHLEGTVIRGDIPDDGAQVKAISAKMGIPLVSISTVGMWQQVGFLADVFDTFKRTGVSVDLVATSEANVTVSLDPVANALDQATLSKLVGELSDVAQAQKIGPCAAVSLVGRNIRAILHQLGPALEVFEEQHIYMMSQAASDLNLTFVVDEEQATRLVRKLHALIFGSRAPDALIGPTWRELFTEDHEAHEPMGHWWVERREELLLEVELGRPAYVYDRSTLSRAIEELDLEQQLLAPLHPPMPHGLVRLVVLGEQL